MIYFLQFTLERNILKQVIKLTKSKTAQLEYE